jgi:hypothetical protein
VPHDHACRVRFIVRLDARDSLVAACRAAVAAALDDAYVGECEVDHADRVIRGCVIGDDNPRTLRQCAKPEQRFAQTRRAVVSQYDDRYARSRVLQSSSDAIVELLKGLKTFVDGEWARRCATRQSPFHFRLRDAVPFRWLSESLIALPNDAADTVREHDAWPANPLIDLAQLCVETAGRIAELNNEAIHASLDEPGNSG